MKATTPSRLRSNAGDPDNEPNPVAAQFPVVVEALFDDRWLHVAASDQLDQPSQAA